jgi:hypothetical protein
VNTFWPIICPVSCEQLRPDELEHGLKFDRSRVNVVSESLHDDEALTSSLLNVCGKSDWIIDSGATQHMTFNKML